MVRTGWPATEPVEAEGQQAAFPVAGAAAALLAASRGVRLAEHVSAPAASAGSVGVGGGATRTAHSDHSGSPRRRVT
jgi:hypothetical protein